MSGTHKSRTFSAPAVKHLRLSSVVFFCGFGLVVSACATATSSDDTVGPLLDAGKADVKLDAKLGSDGRPVNDDAGQCPSQCTTDQDCQSTCPNPQSGLYCCDSQTGVCYVEPSGTCPEPPDSSVGGG